MKSSEHRVASSEHLADIASTGFDRCPMYSAGGRLSLECCRLRAGFGSTRYFLV
jgi:hypothetical protein